MNKKKLILIIFNIVFITAILLAAWSAPFRAIAAVGRNNYLSPSNTPSFVCDQNNIIGMVFYGNLYDTYFSIQYSYYDSSQNKWIFPKRIEDAGSGTGIYAMSFMPTVSCLPNGNKLFAWEDFTTGQFQIHSKFNDEVQLYSQEQVTYSGGFSWSPKLKNKFDKFYLLYRDNSKGVFNLFLCTYDSLWNDSEIVYNSDNDCIDASFDILNDSTISVIYTEFKNNYINLYNIRKVNNSWSEPIPVYEIEGDIFSPFLITNGENEYAIFIANINGLNQLFISNYNGTSWTMPQLLTENNYNIYSPSVIIKNDTIHVFYISDEYFNGVIYDLTYNTLNNEKINTEKVVSMEAEIYTPHAIIDKSETMHLVYVCENATDSVWKNQIYWVHSIGTKNQNITNEKAYNIKYSPNGILLEGDFESVSIIDKTGRIIKKIDNIGGNYFIDSQIINKNDVYFLNIKNKTQKYTEKILWLK